MKWICCIVDNFSLKAFARPMKTKSKIDMEIAMREIIKENNGISCYYLWMDQG